GVDRLRAEPVLDDPGWSEWRGEVVGLEGDLRARRRRHDDLLTLRDVAVAVDERRSETIGRPGQEVGDTHAMDEVLTRSRHSTDLEHAGQTVVDVQRRRFVGLAQERDRV